MKLRSSSILATVRLAIPLIAASILPATAQTNIAAAAATNVVKIAVVPLSDPKGWEDFEKYIKRRLQGTCEIEFVKRDPESALFDLMHQDTSDTVQGAMLSPFGYVVADLWIPNLTLVARMRQVGVIECNQKEKYEPLESYHSVVLMGQQASVQWPPDTEKEPVSVSISDYRSTSEFIFPFAHFSEAGLGSKVKAVPFKPSVKLEKAWQIPDSRPQPSDEEVDTYQQSNKDLYKEQLRQVKGLQASVPVISIADYKLNEYFPSKRERDKDFRELFRSSDSIPFEALVIRKDAVSDPAMKAIRQAFLSTRDMSDEERDLCFKWPEKSSDRKFCGRQPDIHDFIEAQDEDYDVVRAAAAKAFGGRVVNIAISSKVHYDLKKDLPYFRKWMKNVLRRTVGSQPIYIAIQPRESDSNVLLDELESGTVDAAELSAASAARAVGRKTGALVGKALFYKKDENSPDGHYDDHYHFVILAANAPRDPIDKSLRFAYISKVSSSGYQYPFAWLKQRGLNPEERSLIEGHDPDRVFRLLVNKIEKKTPFADYGFLADYEYKKTRRTWSGHDLTKINPVSMEVDSSAIPNTCLVFSRLSFPRVDSVGEPPPTGSSTPPDPDASVVASVKASLVNNDKVDNGLVNNDKVNNDDFGGYNPVTKDDPDLGQLEKFYDQYGNNPLRAGLLLLITLVVLLGAGIAFSFKRRGQAAQTELSIQSLFDVLKGVSSHDRNAQKAVALAIKQLSVLRNATDLSTETLRRELESSLLGLLTLHQPKRGTVDDGRYSAALSTLQTATAVADEQLSEARKSSVIVTNHARSK